MIQAGRAVSELYADPILSANLYCAGELDRVLFGAVAPFWREWRKLDPERLSYLWIMRYGKGGEHVKVRLHGPAEIEPAARSLLTRHVETFLAELGEPVPVEKRGWVGAPPIDDVDDTDTDHPDRSFLWTRYGKSHVSLGGKPFLLDDTYRALMTRCLAQGCEMVLALEPDATGALPHRVRQSTLLKALIGGLAALGFSMEARTQYLSYHRDWLLRFLFPKDPLAEMESIQKFPQLFDERVKNMARSLEPLWRTARAQWQDADSARISSFAGPDAAWRSSLAEFLRYVRPFCEDPDYQLDPFAVDAAFSPIFKVFHGLANQLGLNLADEAFAHHILLAAEAPVSGEPAEPQ